MTTVINTINFDLVELEVKHSNEIYLLRSSDIINQYLDRVKATSIDDAKQFIQKIQTGIAAKNAYYWVIAKKVTGEFLGTICLFGFPGDHNSAELGYELLPQFHGKGVMQEVIPRIIKFGIEDLHLEKIEAELSRRNLKSISLLEKNGFVLVTDDKNEDVVKYCLRTHNPG